MNFKLGTNIQIGQQIKTAKGWRKVIGVDEFGVIVSDGHIPFGAMVFGWKNA